MPLSSRSRPLNARRPENFRPFQVCCKRAVSATHLPRILTRSFTALGGISRKVRPSWTAVRVIRNETTGQSVSTGSTENKSGPQIPVLKQVMFTDASHVLADNPPRLNYGVCVADLDGDGESELFVCGFGFQNQLLKWNGNQLVDIAKGTLLQDPETKSIGVAAGDFDGDGREELYVLNTDTFLGRKKVTDRLFTFQDGKWLDLFSVPRNMDESNMCAGRSVCAVDRKGIGTYSFFVANYGGMMKMFEMTEDGFVVDIAREVGLVTYPTGGRALVSLPLISASAMDIFVGNEGGPNFMFINNADGSGKFIESASAYGLMDSLENCRGVAVVDVRGDGELGLACGNWQAICACWTRTHRRGKSSWIQRCW